MSEIEGLTAEYRAHVGDVAPGALEIIDGQAKRILDLEALLAHLQEDLSKNLFIRDETRAKQGKRIAELEAQVLASDTVSKVEYAAMVAQRDTLREDRKAARILLEDALGWLRAHEASVPEDVPEELTRLIGDIEALPPIRI